MSIQLVAQTFEIRIKRHKTADALKKGAAVSLVRNTIQRALAIARGEAAVTRQSNRRSIERVDRNVAALRFFDRTIDVQRVPGCGRIETP